VWRQSSEPMMVWDRHVRRSWMGLGVARRTGVYPQ